MSEELNFLEYGMESCEKAIAFEIGLKFVEAVNEYKLAADNFLQAANHAPERYMKNDYQKKASECSLKITELKNLNELKLRNLEKAKNTSIEADVKKTVPVVLSEEDNELKESLKNTMKKKCSVRWDDVVGLEDAKRSLRESVEFPFTHPELLPEGMGGWKGILLFGPPGTGKSFIAEAAATELHCTFLSIKASDIQSKYVGENEKKIKFIFEIAREQRPTIIFMDEIDSIARKRTADERTFERSTKTELLTQLEGVGVDNDKVLFLAATNTPWEIDDAVLRRLEKRIHIPLPDEETRESLFRTKLKGIQHLISAEDFKVLGQMSEGFSGSDIASVVKDVSYLTVRKCEKAEFFKQVSVRNSLTGASEMKYKPCQEGDVGAKRMTLHDIKEGEAFKYIVTLEDALDSLKRMSKSVSKEILLKNEKFAKDSGSS